MQALCSTANRAAFLTAFCFLSVLSSCKKDDNNSPTGPSGNACLPVLEFNETSNRAEHTYEYDTQGRLTRFMNPVGTASEQVATSVTRDGQDVILQRPASAAGPAASSRIVMQGGKYTRWQSARAFQPRPTRSATFITMLRAASTASFR